MRDTISAIQILQNRTVIVVETCCWILFLMSVVLIEWGHVSKGLGYWIDIQVDVVFILTTAVKLKCSTSIMYSYFIVSLNEVVSVREVCFVDSVKRVLVSY